VAPPPEARARDHFVGWEATHARQCPLGRDGWHHVVEEHGRRQPGEGRYALENLAEGAPLQGAWGRHRPPRVLDGLGGAPVGGGPCEHGAHLLMGPGGREALIGAPQVEDRVPVHVPLERVAPVDHRLVEDRGVSVQDRHVRLAVAVMRGLFDGGRSVAMFQEPLAPHAVAHWQRRPHSPVPRPAAVPPAAGCPLAARNAEDHLGGQVLVHASTKKENKKTFP